MKHSNQLREPIKSYAQSILFGGNTTYLREHSDIFKRMGIIHLFCISGLHIVYLIKLIELIGKILGFTSETIEDVTLIILPTYFIIGGGSTSLFRAILLYFLRIILDKIHLKIRAPDLWAIILLLNLITNPLIGLTLGGQLSYLLSLSLILLSNQSAWQLSFKLFLLQTPFILITTYQVHILTAIFNSLIIPIFSWIVLPVVFATFWLPDIQVVTNEIVKMFIQIIEMLDDLPGLINFGKPTLFFMLVIIFLTFKSIDFSNESKRLRLIMLLLLSYGLGYANIHLPWQGEVSFFDVGQGDSILIREPFNKTVTIIDTGGKLSFPKPDWAKSKTHSLNANYTIVNYLKSLGISRINNLCLTHQDVDHIGDAEAIFSNFSVENVVITAGMENTNGFKNKIAPFLKEHQLKIVLAGTRLSKLPFEILTPFVPGKGENKDSLTMLGNFGKKTFLFSGDLDQAGEKKLVNLTNNLPQVDVFKLGHHGSRTSNSEELLDKIKPQIAVISAGRDNKFGHPHAEVIDRLKKRQIISISTQQNGMISYRYFVNGMGRWYTAIK